MPLGSANVHIAVFFANETDTWFTALLVNNMHYKGTKYTTNDTIFTTPK